MINKFDLPDHVLPLWETDWTYAALYGGRGGVKSWTAATYILTEGAKRPLRVLCGREVQKSIRQSVHQLLKDHIERLGLGGYYQVLTQEIRGKPGTSAEGTLISFAGLSDLTVDSVKSYEGVSLVWCEEAQTLTRRSLNILLPTIRQEDAQFIFTFNPELDTDEVWKRFIEDAPDDTLILECSYHNNPFFPKILEKQRQQALREVEQGKREKWEYEHVWEGKTKPAVDGAIFAPQIDQCIRENRLTHVPHDPSLFTHLVWDIGYNDDTAIGFVQRAGSSVRLVDFIEDSHRTYESYVSEIRQMVAEKGYRIAIDGRTGGKAWLPHDGKATRPDTGKSPIELINGFGLKADKNGVPNIGISPRIEAARQMFPRVLFDKNNCMPLFNRLRRYARKVSKETGQAGGIHKDGNDHAGDMFTYLAVIEKELNNEAEKMAPINYSNRGIV